MAFIGNTNTTQGFTPAVDFFSGNGSTVAFTLSRPVASVAQVQANISNVPQNPSSAFSVSGNTVTFTSAPPSGTNNIYVYYTSPITQVIAPGQGTVNTTSLGNITNIASGNSSLTLQTGSTPTTALTIDTSQNVGIGTSSPTNKLDVNGALRSIASSNASAGAGVEVDYGGAGTGIGRVLSYDRTGGTFKQLNIQGQPITFVNGGTEAMRIDSSGNLLVGTTSVLGGASGKIALYSSDLTATNGATIKNGTANTGGAFIRFVNSSDATIGSISQNASTTVAYNTSSDARLKTSLGVSTDTSVVDTLIIHDFKWKESGLTDKGVFAQEAYEIKPTAVLVGKDDLTDDGNIANPWGVDYSKFVPDLIVHAQQLKKQVQEQQAIIQTLTDRITALENK